MSKSSKTFLGQTVLVTGGASGIGRSCVEVFAARGAKLVVADRAYDDALELVESYKRRGIKALAVGGDVSNSKDVDAMVAKAVDTFGSIHCLVHSAGVGIEKPLLETTDDEWARVIGIDLTGAFYVLRSVGKVMASAEYGRVVTLASTAGLRGGSGRAAYGAAKGGVIALTKVMSVELALHGVTVNALAPGAIETELVAKMHSEATRINYRRSIPMDRYGAPNEVAEAAAFLGSREAAYITGAVVPVDGGFIGGGIINRE